jgi:NADH dehydrogenase
MPVLINGARSLVGRALARRLLDEGAQVRAYLRREDAALRAVGVHVAIGEPCDVPKLESALTQVHTLVHLVGGEKPERGVSLDFFNRETVECSVIAARSAGVKRILFVSALGADPGARDKFLAAKGAAETLVVESGCEYGIFRCAPIAESGRRGAQLPLERVVDALAGADEREAFTSGVFTLE